MDLTVVDGAERDQVLRRVFAALGAVNDVVHLGGDRAAPAAAAQVAGFDLGTDLGWDRSTGHQLPLNSILTDADNEVMQTVLDRTDNPADTDLIIEEWVTFYETWHPGLRRWVLTQKCNGATRTILR